MVFNLIFYAITTITTTNTANTFIIITTTKVLRLNIEGKFELNQKTLCVCTLSKKRISRIELSVKLELSGNA